MMKECGDLRWTIRFDDRDDLVCLRNLCLSFARLTGVTAGRFLRIAVERLITEQYGSQIVQNLVALSRDGAALQPSSATNPK